MGIDNQPPKGLLLPGVFYNFAIMNENNHLQISRQYNAPVCIVKFFINKKVLCASMGLNSLSEQNMDEETTWSY